MHTMNQAVLIIMATLSALSLLSIARSMGEIAKTMREILGVLGRRGDGR